MVRVRSLPLILKLSASDLATFVYLSQGMDLYREEQTSTGKVFMCDSKIQNLNQQVKGHLVMSTFTPIINLPLRGMGDKYYILYV